MAQPSAYNRAYNFSNFQAANPEQPLPAGSLDEELSRIKAVFDQIRSNLALIQRDDTSLANRTVGYDQLKTEISIGVNPPTTWVTSTNYIIRDSVFKDQKFYVALVSHVSGVFADDLAADKWELVADFTAAQAASLVTYDNSTSGLTAENLQDAVDEIAGSINVSSVFGRAGAVVATAGDYTADKITVTPAGALAATDAQAALEELDSDLTSGLAGKSDVGHTHAQSDITGLSTALAGKVPTTRSVATSGLATGGGDLSASRTINVAEASQAEAQAGTASNVVLTPRRGVDLVGELALGIGQTFQNVSGSRSADTTYQNTTGRVIQVNMVLRNDVSQKMVQVSANGSSWVNVGATAPGAGMATSFPVPPGHYYRINGNADIAVWSELR